MSHTAGATLLHYTDEGTGDPVVFVHAFPLDGRMWQPQRQALAGRARAIVPDLRGFGRSAMLPEATSVDAHADDLAALLDRLGLERATLVGLSMGGYISLAFARRHPTRLARLLLADTKATADGAEGKSGREKNAALVMGEGTAPLVERMLPALLSKGAAPAVVSLVRAVGASQQPAGVRAALLTMRDRPDSTPLLGEIRAPVTVVVGEEDGLTPPSDANALAGAIWSAKLVTIPGAGHLANLEAPAAFDAALAELLAREPAS